MIYEQCEATQPHHKAAPSEQLWDFFKNTCAHTLVFLVPEELNLQLLLGSAAASAAAPPGQGSQVRLALQDGRSPKASACQQSYKGDFAEEGKAHLSLLLASCPQRFNFFQLPFETVYSK